MSPYTLPVKAFAESTVSEAYDAGVPANRRRSGRRGVETMTRRERLERKIENRREWAIKAEARAEQHYATSNRLVENIPFGQPILVGHHSESSHRRTLERSRNHMFAMVDENKKAALHESKAAGIENQLDRCVFSDDENAIEAITERLAANEARRERMKRVNALYRKGDSEGLAALGLNLDSIRASLKDAYSWCQQPHPAYELSNLGQRISGDKKRIETIKMQNARKERAEAAGGVAIVRGAQGYAQVTFAEKPDYSVIRALKDAGFHWSGGSWFGTTEKLPATVAALEAEAA